MEEPSVGDDIPQGGCLFWTSIVTKVAMYIVNSWVTLDWSNRDEKHF